MHLLVGCPLHVSFSRAGICPFWSLQNPQSLQQGLAHSRCSLNIVCLIELLLQGPALHTPGSRVRLALGQGSFNVNRHVWLTGLCFSPTASPCTSPASRYPLQRGWAVSWKTRAGASDVNGHGYLLQEAFHDAPNLGELSLLRAPASLVVCYGCLST